MTLLQQSILSTLVYYDILDRPLTAWEVFKYLKKVAADQPRVQFRQLKQELDNPDLKKYLSYAKGFYFLKNRKKLVALRIYRQKISDQKWKKVKKWLFWLQAIPYIRLVIGSGSLAMHNSKKESDLDLLIVTKASRIWTCRALITLFFQIIGQRRHHHLTQDRFCLNHYLTDQSLTIQAQSLYTAQLYAHLVPVLETEPKLFLNWQKENLWLRDYLFRHQLIDQGFLETHQIKKSSFLNSIRQAKESFLNLRIGDWLEKYLRQFQKKRIAKDPLTYQAGGRVIFNDHQLEFHPNSPEKNILAKYNLKMKKLGLAELAQEKDSGLLKGILDSSSLKS